ncbi:hypothetical protein EBT16_11295 [bacterium]|nr:hypothetical protein [bacterium]
MKIPYSSDDLVRAYRITDSGHFFDKDTMRFFRSRVSSAYRRLSDKKALFVTSEKKSFSDTTRVFTLRLATVKGNKIKIDTVGELGAFKSLNGAKGALKKFNQRGAK